MSKKIAVLLAFLSFGLIFYSPVKAQTQVLFLNDGGYNTVTNELVILCFNQTECYDVHTMQRIGDVATKVDQTNVKVDNTSAKVDQLNQKIDQLQNTVNQLQTTVATPVPAPTPVVESPIVGGIPQAPAILPAYTESQLGQKFGTAVYKPVVGGFDHYVLPVSCTANSLTTATCGGSHDSNFVIKFNDAVVQGNITGLTPDTEYSYNVIYSEQGREDSIFTKSFRTISVSDFCSQQVFAIRTKAFNDDPKYEGRDNGISEGYGWDDLMQKCFSNYKPN